VELKDIERAINRDTRLVAISLISYINGFQHDVRSICDIAHRHGALVYLDIIQAAGAMPIDIKALDADFAATASYKWLMGDFGLGFLYAKKELLGTRVVRPVHSYKQLTAFDNHMFPYDGPNDEIVSYEAAPNAAGFFEQGTLANPVSEVLSYSLQYIQDLGVANIHQYSQSLIAELRSEVPKLGFPCITPENAQGPLVAFELSDPATTAAKLQRANIDVTISGHRMRVSPSVYNTRADLQRFFRALK
jgi:selenocysteine lyase/cysteine desulfurase